MAIVTAKPQIFAERIAKKFGFAPYLDDVIGPGLDNKDSSKAALVRRGMEAFGGSVVMVGDRRFDIEGAGRTAWIPSACAMATARKKSWFPPMRRILRIPWRN